jgi:cytosine/adenosine deaminase-related metal-dependent hydrolase
VHTSAKRNAQIMHAKRPELKPLSVAEAFYLLTLGGAQVLSIDHKVGNFVVGKVHSPSSSSTHALARWAPWLTRKPGAGRACGGAVLSRLADRRV